MPKFIVKKPCRPNGVEYKTKGEVELTERQAKYLVMSGHLEPKALPKKAQKAAKA